MVISKIIVFLFVAFLFFYMIRLLSFNMSKRWYHGSKTFIILLCGISIMLVGTFADIFSHSIDNRILYVFIKMCLTIGCIVYVVGVVRWSNYTKNMMSSFEEMALMDAMTDTYNRRGVERVFERYTNSGKQFYIMVCDLDWTKQINDQYGHLAGDEYIQKAVHAIKGNVNNRGSVARIGGDEFAVVFQDAELHEICKVIEKIKLQVEGLFPDKRTGISIGYAKYPVEGSKLELLLTAADQRMYEDKLKSKQGIGRRATDQTNSME